MVGQSNMSDGGSVPLMLQSFWHMIVGLTDPDTCAGTQLASERELMDEIGIYVLWSRA